MFKKCTSLLLALALITVLFTGCRGNAKNENQTGDPGTSTTSATTATKTADTTVRPTNVGSRSYSKEKVVWGPGNIADHARPQEPERLQKQFGALGARFLLDNKKQLCLTFDEGYENGYSGKILDTLKEKKVHAIFFVTYDFASQNPALIKRMIAEGHVVGNHTYRHLTMDEVTRAAATEEITVLHRYMEKNYQYKMTYFRFPKGSLARTRWRWHRSWATRVFLELCLCRLGYPKCGGTGSGAAKGDREHPPGRHLPTSCRQSHQCGDFRSGH